MKWEVDKAKELNILYIKAPNKSTSAELTLEVECFVDYDENGKLIGIEVLLPSDEIIDEKLRSNMPKLRLVK